MAAGIEGREPLANIHTFMQAIKVSPSQLMTDGLGKIPLRNIIAKYMGKDFAFSSKVGFLLIYGKFSIIRAMKLLMKYGLKKI